MKTFRCQIFYHAILQMSDDEKRRIDRIVVDTIFACRKDESSRLR